MPVAVITGASRGFGKALAEDLAREETREHGLAVLVGDDVAENVAALLDARHDGVDHAVFDQNREQSIGHPPFAVVRKAPYQH